MATLSPPPQQPCMHTPVPAAASLQLQTPFPAANTDTSAAAALQPPFSPPFPPQRPHRHPRHPLLPFRGASTPANLARCPRLPDRRWRPAAAAAAPGARCCCRRCAALPSACQRRRPRPLPAAPVCRWQRPGQAWQRALLWRAAQDARSRAQGWGCLGPDSCGAGAARHAKTQRLTRTFCNAEATWRNQPRRRGSTRLRASTSVQCPRFLRRHPSLALPGSGCSRACWGWTAPGWARVRPTG